MRCDPEREGGEEEGRKRGDRKGGKERRRQGDKEKRTKGLIIIGMEEDRTIMLHAYCSYHTHSQLHKSLTWSHLSMHFWWKS